MEHQLLRPITVGRSSLRPGPHRYTCRCRASSEDHVVFFPGPPRLPVPVLVLPLPPWLKLRRRVPEPTKRKKLWQQRPTLQPQDPRPRQQLQYCQPLPVRLSPQAARRCCPVSATSGRTTTRKPTLHGAPEEEGQAHVPKAGAKAARPSTFRRLVVACTARDISFGVHSS